MANSIIYGRQSVERLDSVSIDTQIEQCKKFVEGEYVIYSDVGYSGKNMIRPNFEKLISDVKSGKVDTIISYRLDRISRNIVDFANLLSLFEKHNVKFISATEGLSTDSVLGRTMVYIVMVFAQLERETIVTRITDNYRHRSKLGYYMGGNKPYGYSSIKVPINGKNMAVLQANEEAETLKLIFDLFSSKDNIAYIVRTLNQSGVTTSKGNLWTTNAVRRILQNITPCTADEQMYDYLDACGYTITNRREDFTGEKGMSIFFKNKNKNQPTDIKDQIVAIGVHTPLISSTQFIKAQNVLNSTTDLERKKSSKKSFLAGLIKCNECKHSFGLKTTEKSGKTYSYYCCRGRLSRFICTNDLYISSELLEKEVIEKCKEYLENCNASKEIAEYKTSKISNDDEITIIQQQIENLINNIGNGNSIVDDLLTKKITVLQEKINSIKKEIVNVKLESNKSDLLEEYKNLLVDFDSCDISNKSNIIRKLIKSINISHDGSISIIYAL